MIRDIFLPQKIGAYYLFKKRVVSFSISKQSVTALCMTLHARTKKITQSFNEAIPYDLYETSELAISATIAKILKNTNSYNELVVIINSSYAIFKELTVPLLDEEKIAQIVGFELENYLPFPVSDAAFDFIITHQDVTAQSSDIFAVAIQKEKIEFYSNIFLAAGAKIDTFLVDAFDVFGLYTNTNTLAAEKAQLVIFSDNERTTTLYLEGKKLKKVRILQESPTLENDAWWQALTFTFQSCIENWIGEKEIILYGNYSQEFLTKAKLLFQDNCLLIPVEEIIKNLSITIEKPEINTFIPLNNLATTLDFNEAHHFNLHPSTHNLETTRTAIGNYITAAILMVILYSAFGFHAFFEVQKFSNASEKIKMKIVKDLKTALPSLKSSSPTEAIRKAKAEITKEEDIWFSFSSQTRHSFLTYLFDLSTAIDRDTLGLDLKKMTFNKNGITLEGSVRSFDAVEELIKQLKNTGLFTQVPNLQTTEFIMPLILANQEERS